MVILLFSSQETADEKPIINTLIWSTVVVRAPGDKMITILSSQYISPQSH